MFIGYAATVFAHGLRLRYGAVLTQDAPGAPLAQRQSLRRPVVRIGDADVRVTWPALGVSGRWRDGAAAGPCTVADVGGRTVEWRALALNADVALRVGNCWSSGVGYAEVVRLSLPPWRLPFADLGWGRFVADDRASALTWIATGPDGISQAWTPSLPAGAPASVTEAGVATEGADLRWEAGSTIRREVVSTTLLRRLAPVGAALPAGLRDIREHKLLSRGVLADERGEREGWVIHERVRWGPRAS